MEHISKNYYDAVLQKTDVKRIVNDGIIDAMDYKCESDKLYVVKKVNDYRNSIVLDSENAVIDMNELKRIKNSTVVRYIHIITAHVGRILGDD